MPDSVENLQIWKESASLVEAIYLATKPWPKEETYGLTSQMRRAAVTIPANLAEGIGRGTYLETARFAQIALGSLYECDTLLVIAERLGYIDCEATRELAIRLRGSASKSQASLRTRGGVMTQDSSGFASHHISMLCYVPHTTNHIPEEVSQ